MSTKGKKFVKSEMDTELPNYFESDKFKKLCLLVVGNVRKAGKLRLDATFRYLAEQIGSNEWLFEAVEHCKRAGLIAESGSEIRTVFTVGGKELKPEKSKGYSKGVSVSAVPSQTSHLPDFYFDNCNR
jgi:hypothetical protein